MLRRAKHSWSRRTPAFFSALLGGRAIAQPPPLDLPGMFLAVPNRNHFGLITIIVICSLALRRARRTRVRIRDRIPIHFEILKLAVDRRCTLFHGCPNFLRTSISHGHLVRREAMGIGARLAFARDRDLPLPTLHALLRAGGRCAQRQECCER